MANRGINMGMGNKGKNSKSTTLLIPTKKLPPTLPHQGQATLYSNVSPRSLPTTEKPGKETLDKIDQLNTKQIKH